MRFGLSFLPDSTPATKAPTAYYDEVLELARYGDQAGFDYVKMTEHYLHPYGGYCPSPLTFLTAVAAQTRNIRLITGCVLPVFHHPVQLASLIAMVDAISNGRLEIGFARAYLPHEFVSFDVPMDGSRARFEATVAAVHRLLTEEKVSEETPFFTLRDATVLPRPTQQPRPPFWIAAVQTPASFRRIGELGYGLLITPTGRDFDTSMVELYRESFAAHHPGERARVMASMPLVVADTDQEARAIADPHLNRYLQVWGSALESWDETVSSDYAQYTGLAASIRTLTAKDLRANGSAIVGSPEHVVEQIGRFQERTHADGLLWQADFGDFGGAAAMRSTELFADKVRPHFPAVAQ
ncbi:LLM class flavin-dependent oxidoreductase [Peterkaempfera bronchialis]|uniref:LLM class flavin-dependent oxidoreductase n=1 Tax=Peterkaempfera bronchialis TaxID=2126346 RepID=UPI0013B41E16|nr:LLM class flavin-dependent oxidoreductase [Peterkaempfera bronchialis]